MRFLTALRLMNRTALAMRHKSPRRSRRPWRQRPSTAPVRRLPTPPDDLVAGAGRSRSESASDISSRRDPVRRSLIGANGPVEAVAARPGASTAADSSRPSALCLPRFRIHESPAVSTAARSARTAAPGRRAGEAEVAGSRSDRRHRGSLEGRSLGASGSAPNPSTHCGQADGEPGSDDVGLPGRARLRAGRRGRVCGSVTRPRNADRISWQSADRSLEPMTSPTIAAMTSLRFRSSCR